MAFRLSVWHEIRRSATSSRHDRVDMRNLLFGALFPAPDHQCLVEMACFFRQIGSAGFGPNGRRMLRKFRGTCPPTISTPWQNFTPIRNCKNATVFFAMLPILTVCPNSWPSARLFITKFDGQLRPVDAIVWICGTCYLELFSRPPTTNVWFRWTAFFGKSGEPDLDQTFAECLENLEERARQQYLQRGKILRQSETAKTQLFFWQCFRYGPFALIHGFPLVCLARNSTGSYVQSTRSCGCAELIIWSSFPGPRPPMFG